MKPSLIEDFNPETIGTLKERGIVPNKLLFKSKLSQIYLASTKKKDEVILKILSPVPRREKFTKEIYENEINALSKCKSPYIVKLYDNFIMNENKYIVLEKINGEDLFETMKKKQKIKNYFTESQVLDIIKQVARALKYLHEKHIIHADIKPENIMVINQFTLKIKLIDFGLSKMLNENETFFTREGEYGTLYYMAPEVMSRKAMTYDIDIWALGIVFSEILAGAGKSVFYSDCDYDVCMKIEKYSKGMCTKAVCQGDECIASHTTPYSRNELYKLSLYFPDLSLKYQEIIHRFLRAPYQRITLDEIFAIE